MVDELPPFVSRSSEGFLLEIYLAPRSSSKKIMGTYDGRLKVAVNAAPVDGKANKELLAFLSKLLRCPLSSFSIVKGKRSKKKTLLISGVRDLFFEGLQA